MTHRPAIPPEILERAEILMDQFRDVEDDRELIALVLMEAAKPAPRRPTNMTQRQAEAYAFISSFSADHGYCPSYSQIAEAIGASSKSRVSEVVLALEDRGLITRRPGCARSLSITMTARA